MGGKSKKVTIGYKYHVGLHAVFCHGPIDKFTRITVDDRRAWYGTTTGGQISISAPELFGGETREGGVSGTVDVEMGALDQPKNPYLLSKIGPNIPAYRGVAAMVFRDFYWGNNPYLKPVRARGTRIHTAGDGGLQWYDEKAEIAVDEPPDDFWYSRVRVEYQNPSTSTPGGGYFFDPPGGAETLFNNEKGVPGSGDHVEEVPFQHIDFVYETAPLTTGQGNLRLQFSSGTVGADMRCRAKIKHFTSDDWTILFPKDGSDSTADANGWFDVRGLWPDNWLFDLTGAEAVDSGAMNPAHIIRECLTNPDWGMGYAVEDIDDASFIAAADTLFAERMGMSLFWDEEAKIEDFVNEVVRHIDAALFVSRSTGQFVLKLIRDDYDVDALITLDESNVDKLASPRRPEFGELINSVTVQFWNTFTGRDDSVTVSDPAGVQMQGAPINTTVQYQGFTTVWDAQRAGARDLRALSNPFFSCTVYAGKDAAGLEIGDVFKLSWAKWSLSNVVMRVIGYARGRGDQVRLTVVEDVFSTPMNAVIVPPADEWEDPSQPPEATEYEMALEVPYYELVQQVGQTEVDANLATDPDLGLVLGAAARPGAAINARLWTDAGAGYAEVDALDFCPSATISTPLGKKDESVVLLNGLDLDLVEVGDFCQLGDELMRVDSLNPETGEFTFGRGVLDTVPHDHPADERVFFWDAYSGIDPTEYASGETVDVKITPITGMGQLPVGQASALPVTLDQRAFRPYPPGDLLINGESYEDAVYQDELTVSWTHRDRLQETGGDLIDHFAGNVGPEPGTTYRVQVYVDDVFDSEQDDIVNPPALVTPLSDGTVRIEVSSKRDGIYSMQAATHEFAYSHGAIRATEADDLRLTVDGDYRATED